MGHLSEEKLKIFQAFIGLEMDISKFIHTTPTRQYAEEIIENGFEFENHLMHTTDQVSGFDLVELNYFLMIRRNYGHFTLVIEIADILIIDYTRRLRACNCHFSEALSKNPPRYNDDDNPVYTLPEQFIKGFFDQETSERVYNPLFDPYYRSAIFEENISRLTG
ncbi:MAG: hypothetical protein JSV24_12185 [Bacteroidales bacterium]|nr:MAG: hypothetical protein JSV24_12185 [Bacteroidales bacterium]